MATPQEIELARSIIAHVPSAELVLFCVTGTEATPGTVVVTITGSTRRHGVAEVDKFIMLMECLVSQANAPAAGQLTRLLFDAGVYHDDLSFTEMKRYREAAAYARTYCRRLESRYLGRGDRDGLLAELRKFYRLNKEGKLRRILGPH